MDKRRPIRCRRCRAASTRSTRRCTALLIERGDVIDRADRASRALSKPGAAFRPGREADMMRRARRCATRAALPLDHGRAHLARDHHHLHRHAGAVRRRTPTCRRRSARHARPGPLLFRLLGPRDESRKLPTARHRGASPSSASDIGVVAVRADGRRLVARARRRRRGPQDHRQAPLHRTARSPGRHCPPIVDRRRRSPTRAVARHPRLLAVAAARRRLEAAHRLAVGVADRRAVPGTTSLVEPRPVSTSWCRSRRGGRRGPSGRSTSSAAFFQRASGRRGRARRD